jgi:simple sugar transport system permease protein
VTEKPLRSTFDWQQHLRTNASLLRLAFITVLIFVVMSLLRPNLFPTASNFTSMAFQFPEFAILALAMMLAMLTGGIDLSIIANMNLSAILAGLVLSRLTDDPTAPATLTILLATLIALSVGTLAGFINGVLIAKTGIPPILATLGTSQVYLGLAIVLTGGAAVHGFPNAFSAIGNGSLGIVPIPLILFAALALGVALLLNKTPYGFKLYMLGTNPLAARFAGLDNPRLLILTYTLAGWLAAASGILIMSRTNSIRADFGASYLLLTILVAVLGGINPYGGFGKVSGLVLAVLSLQFLSSGFNMLRFSNFAREFIWGALLLLVMVLSTVSLVRRRKTHGPQRERERR